jgi:peptide deformylase
VFSYNIDGVIGHLVNPVIVQRSEEVQDGDEGCLSVPGIWAPTVRAMHCVAEGFDVHGEPVRLEGSGLMARCLQHEVDHLDGTVFLDRLTGEARKGALRALRSH